MEIFGQLLLMVTLAAGVQQTLAQNVSECAVLSTDLGIAVPDLPVCVDGQSDNSQCCVNQYVMQQQMMIEQQFLDGLRIELRERFQEFNTIVDSTRMYINGDFLTGYFRSIGKLDFVGGANGVVEKFLSDLRKIIDFPSNDDLQTKNGSNIQQFLDQFLMYIENAAVQTLTGQTNQNNVSQCIRQVIESHIEVKNMQVQAIAIEQMQRIIASLDQLQSLVNSLTENLAGFRPLPQCVNTLVLLNKCGRCTMARPSLCENVCEAIANACYSAFNDALGGQLNQLWEVVRGIIDATNDAITAINSKKGLFNATAIITQISTECQIEVKLPVVRRQASDDDDDEDEDDNVPALPSLIQSAAVSLGGGPFDYTGRAAEGSGLCRLFNTSDSNCWDGMTVRADDIEEFDGVTIKDQVNNPVIKIPPQDLTDQLATLGTPVTDVITSPAFSQVAPVGLVLPNGGESGANGAMSVFFTTSSFALMLLAGILVLIL